MHIPTRFILRLWSLEQFESAERSLLHRLWFNLRLNIVSTLVNLTHEDTLDLIWGTNLKLKFITTATR
jgi:hypothetical protein